MQQLTKQEGIIQDLEGQLKMAEEGGVDAQKVPCRISHQPPISRINFTPTNRVMFQYDFVSPITSLFVYGDV
jgi:hypothetical protein